MKNRSHPHIWTTGTYNRLSPYYDRFMKFFFPIGGEARARIIGKLVSGSVLDVACGTGTLLEMAEVKGLQCYGIDISAGMLAQAKKKVPNAKVSLASCYEIPYPEGCFDYVTATNALSSDSIDVKKVLSEMIRVCKSGGEIYIAEWPKAQIDISLERLVVWFAHLNDDAPKNYLMLFREYGYEPGIDIISKRYHVYGIRK